MKKILLIGVLLLISNNLQAQKINWISFEEAVKLNKTTPKKFLIDVYTDWCGYCKKMDRETYENANVIEVLNKHFYTVKLNAEQREPITYKEKTFKFVPNGNRGFNEFAYSILNGKMSYPSTVFLSQEESIIETLPGYLDPVIMEKIIVYLGEDRFKTQKWDEFETEFNTRKAKK